MFYLTYLWSFLTQRKKRMETVSCQTIRQHEFYGLNTIYMLFCVFFRKYLKFKKISTNQEAFISYCLPDSYYAQKYKAHILK